MADTDTVEAAGFWTQFIDEQPPLTTAYAEFERAFALGKKAALDSRERELEQYREALKVYSDVCSNCHSVASLHDEKGQVDMMDEMGLMICGKPEYPAATALKGKEEGNS